MQTIVTKFLSPTNSKGLRIKAMQSGWISDKRCEVNQLTIPYTHDLIGQAAHAKAAMALAEKLQWHGKYVGGSLGAMSDCDYVFVKITDADTVEVQP